MSDATTPALVATAAATGLLHTLIPDHWLPFVLIGRARGWGAGTAALVSGTAAVIHTGLSVLLGLAAIAIGVKTAGALGETLEGVAGLMLVGFGLLYAAWAWRKGGHFHPGGALLHRGDRAGGCAGVEGDANPEHLHYHADEGLIRGGGRWGGFGLAAIIGLNPCVLIFPIILASAGQGAEAVALVAIAYSVPTAILMVGLAVIGVRVGWRIRLGGAARYAEMGSGLLIAGLGGVLWLAGR